MSIIPFSSDVVSKNKSKTAHPYNSIPIPYTRDKLHLWHKYSFPSRQSEERCNFCLYRKSQQNRGSQSGSGDSSRCASRGMAEEQMHVKIGSSQSNGHWKGHGPGCSRIVEQPAHERVFEFRRGTRWFQLRVLEQLFQGPALGW